MSIPRADSTLAARVKKLEEDFRRIKLTPSVTQSSVAPTAAVKNSMWIDSSAGNEPKVWDGTAWVPARDQTIAVAQSTADTAQATVNPLVPLTALAGQTSGTTVTGATVETSSTAPRIAMNDPAYPNELIWESGNSAETMPARVQSVVPSGLQAQLAAHSPALDGGSRAGVSLTADAAALGGLTHAQIDAAEILLNTFGAGAAVKVTDAAIELNRPVHNADLSSPTNTFPTNPQPVEVDEQTDLLTLTNTSFAAGSPVCGTTFVAPPSGKVYITVSGHLQGNASGSLAYLSYEVRDGGTIGSGTVIQAALTDRGVAVGSTVTGLSAARASLSRRTIVATGLTPGSTYNIRTMHLLAGSGSISIFSRELLVEPVL